MTPDQKLMQWMEATGLPWDEPFYREHAAEMMQKGISPDEAKTRRCDDCNTALQVHPTAKWRFDGMYPMRCEACQQVALQAGYTPWEAKYVS